MLWDDFQIRHIDDLKLKVKGYSDDECKEFDTTEDILQFYPNFKDFIEQFFAEEELLISSNFWNLVCKSEKGYDIVIDEYKKNAHLIIEALAKIKNAYLRE